MHAPDFWSGNTQSLLPPVLAPVALLFDIATRTRIRLTTPERLPVPVICVGNFVAGGAGKTPTALALADMIQSHGLSTAFLSRGYGGSNRQPLKVDTELHKAAATGDEPLLLARRAPTFIGVDRRAAAKLALETGPDCLIMDDGLQNPHLAKTLSVAVIDAAYGLGNGYVIPAGPLRAALPFQLRLCHALIILGDGKAADPAVEAAVHHGLPCFQAQIEISNLDELQGEPVLAFAGMGRPQKFFSSLNAAGIRLIAGKPFPDHHPYSQQEALNLLAAADKAGAQLATTEKDHVRLRGGGGALGELAVRAVPVTAKLRFNSPDAVADFVLSRIRRQ